MDTFLADVHEMPIPRMFFCQLLQMRGLEAAISTFNTCKLHPFNTYSRQLALNCDIACGDRKLLANLGSNRGPNRAWTHPLNITTIQHSIAKQTYLIRRKRTQGRWWRLKIQIFQIFQNFQNFQSSILLNPQVHLSFRVHAISFQLTRG